MDEATRFQIVHETVCISHGNKICGKGTNPIILPLIMHEKKSRRESLTKYGKMYRKMDSHISNLLTPFKSDLLSHPLQA